MIARGYAAAVIRSHEIAPDYAENFTTQFHRLFPEYTANRPPDAWGAITAWAWGMSRAIDYLTSDSAINGRYYRQVSILVLQKLPEIRG